MSTASVTGIFLIGTWLVLVVVAQFRPGLRQQLWWLALVLNLPNWGLFLSPGLTYRIEYRDRLSGGGMTDWHIAALRPRQRFVTLMWDSAFLTGFYVRSQLDRLRASLGTGRLQDVDFLIAFAVVKNHVAQQPKSSDTTARQFRVCCVDRVPESPTDRVLIESSFSSC